MKILFCYVPYMFRHSNYFERGKQFDFPNLYDNPSGLTGSETSCFTLAQRVADKGHEVCILTTCGPNRTERWGSVRIIPMDSRNDIGVLGGNEWDVVYSWNELDAMMYVDYPNIRGTLRMVNMQINDLNHGSDGFDKYIDVYTSPSESHREVIGAKSPDSSKWEVVPNGCDPTIYRALAHKHKVVDGRVIYASSPDRGLHWLLQIWPQVKKAVPHAHLKIFYEIKKWMDPLVTNYDKQISDIATLSNRARYIQEALRRLEGHGVHVIGSVSRNRMAEEFCQAQVLAYPCDTINYTEGFSVTLMEACASHTMPVSTNVDALGEIYGGIVPMVQSPVGDRIDEYSDLLIRALKDKSFRDRTLAKTEKLARSHDWKNIATDLMRIIARRGKK